MDRQRAGRRTPEAVQAAYERYLALRQEVYGVEKAARRPQTLMDIATMGAKVLKKRGLLRSWTRARRSTPAPSAFPLRWTGRSRTGFLMFKNETHNHPTEIEPFGGAATCIGGCIRDPLSGRAYVHQAMRVTGCGDPRNPFETLSGKLPQRKICHQTAAAGLLLLRKPDRPCHRPCGGGLSRGLRRQAPGMRRRGGRRPAGNVIAGSVLHPGTW
ncbi:MAG: hypothetical protein V8R75_16075 [Oscillospiraceae bacterium]